MPFAQSKGVRIHWHETGEGSPILLIMGHRYSSRMWYPAIPALATRHRVIRFDNRGTGRSGYSKNFSVSDLADDAIAVMNAAGVDKAHIYGVSMGGGIALELAQKYPQRVRSLLLGCTCIKSDVKQIPNLVLLLYYLPSFILQALISKGSVKDSYGSAASDHGSSLDRAAAKSDPHVTRGLIEQLRAVGRYTTTTEAISKLTMPSLVLHGDEDALVPYRLGVELSKALPNSQMVTLEGAGHNYFVAQGYKANRAALDFLGAIDSP